MFLHMLQCFLLFSDNPSLQSHVPVTVQVLDVNDNPPMINTEDEIIICESTRAGQASPKTVEVFLCLAFIPCQ